MHQLFAPSLLLWKIQNCPLIFNVVLLAMLVCCPFSPPQLILSCFIGLLPMPYHWNICTMDEICIIDLIYIMHLEYIISFHVIGVWGISFHRELSCLSAEDFYNPLTPIYRKERMIHFGVFFLICFKLLSKEHVFVFLYRGSGLWTYWRTSWRDIWRQESIS